MEKAFSHGLTITNSVVNGKEANQNKEFFLNLMVQREILTTEDYLDCDYFIKKNFQTLFLYDELSLFFY
jgi:hypothetical protein